jgi:hypothetical protein
MTPTETSSPIAFVAGCKPYSACYIIMDGLQVEKHGSTPDRRFREASSRDHFDGRPLTSTRKGASTILLEQAPQWASSQFELRRPTLRSEIVRAVPRLLCMA